MRIVTFSVLSVFVAIRALSGQELPPAMLEAIESGRVPLDTYVRMMIGCTARYRVAALAHMADGRAAEAAPLEERARGARAAVIYLLELERADTRAGAGPNGALDESIDLRVEAEMERIRQSFADPLSDSPARFLANVKRCDESGDLWRLVESIGRTTER